MLYWCSFNTERAKIDRAKNCSYLDTTYFDKFETFVHNNTSTDTI